MTCRWREAAIWEFQLQSAEACVRTTAVSYLKAFLLDTLKIDQTFVRQLLNEGGDAAIVRATIDLGRLLGLSIIAEEIEDVENTTPSRTWDARKGRVITSDGHFLRRN